MVISSITSKLNHPSWEQQHTMLLTTLLDCAPMVWDPTLKSGYTNSTRCRGDLPNMCWIGTEIGRASPRCCMIWDGDHWRLTMMYKIVSRFVSIDGQSLHLSHTKTYIVPHTKTDYHQNRWIHSIMDGISKCNIRSVDVDVRDINLDSLLFQ